jgi:hypothetical protein
MAAQSEPTHQPAHHQGWMISGRETVICWPPVLCLTMLVTSVAGFFTPSKGNTQPLPTWIH